MKKKNAFMMKDEREFLVGGEQTSDIRFAGKALLQ